MKDFLLSEFIKLYGYKPVDFNIFFAPGRINIIGEHTDYTGGIVFPASIDCGTYMFAVQNKSSEIRLSSLNFENTVYTIELNEPQIKTNLWIDYFKGCICELRKKYKINNGFDALIFGNIPNSSGLSSSASVEMVSIIALLGMNDIEIPQNGTKEMVDLTIAAKNCENNFIGVNCGIMDQFAIGNGRKNNCILLDCYDLSFHYSQINLGDYCILVGNTNKKRRLEESKYNERRKECEDGFEMLKRFGINRESLGRVTVEQWNDVKDKFNDFPVIKKRLNHVINENNRVKMASFSLKKNDLLNFCALINQSGDSLREDFEVTGIHLDALVESSRSTDGVLASRMTGAGFGGCNISIAKKSKIETIKREIGDKYYKAVNIKADFYTFDIDDGARKIY